jgi:hypothetical protein
MDGLPLVSVRAEKPAKNPGSLAGTGVQKEKRGQEGENKPPVAVTVSFFSRREEAFSSG